MALCDSYNGIFDQNGVNGSKSTGNSKTFNVQEKIKELMAMPSEPHKTNKFFKSRQKDFNRGVSHGIKKPRQKKNQDKKRLNKVKQVISQSNSVEKPSRLASNRIPLVSSKGRFHKLSSPGVSYLSDSTEESTPERKKGKFFNSRSTVDANVNITDKVKLVSVNGHIKMKAKERSFEKRNIGRCIEMELDKQIAASAFSSPADNLSKLQEARKLSSALSSSPVRKPTRFPTRSPSPNRRHSKTSPQKALRQSPRKRGTPNKENVSRSHRNSPQKRSLNTNSSSLSPQKRQTNFKSHDNSPKKRPFNSNGPCNSPQKYQSNSKDPSNSPLKLQVNSKGLSSSPQRRPANSNVPYNSPQKRSLSTNNLDLGLSPSPRRRSPRKLALYDSDKENLSPIKSRSNKGSIVEDEMEDAGDELEDLSAFLEDFDESCQEDHILTNILKENQSPPKDCGRVFRESPRKKLATSRSPDKAKDSKKRESVKNVKYFPIFELRSEKMTRDSIKPQTRSSPSKSKKFLLKKSDMSQMIIDAGQREFGSKFCAECGTLYEPGDPEDERMHSHIHNNTAKCLKYLGWKNEDRVTDLDENGGRIVRVRPDGPKTWWRKVEEILECVDRDLGFSESGIRVKSNTTAFLYVLEKQMVGILVAEAIDKAYKVIPEGDLVAANDFNKDGKYQDSDRLLCCSETPQKVYYGISRIWVLSAFRRRKIASKLVSAMRSNIIPYHFLSLEDFAFSDPTVFGRKFAENYAARGDFLVYRRE